MKIVTVVGARPQFVKAAVVSAALRTAGLQEVMIHTGQHYDYNMSEVFFSALGIPAPKISLGIGGGSHGQMTGKQLIEIERSLQSERPDFVLVFGDTNSTLAGALAAVKLHIPIAHVEAGLRSFNMRMPEEINRVLTDRISTVLYTPSILASQNLRDEGVEAERIFEVGDVMFDATLRFSGGECLPTYAGQLYGLVTIHRAENTDDELRLTQIVDSLCAVSENLKLVFPLHPRTRQRLQILGLYDRLAAAIDLIEPLGYIELLALLKNSALVITDSGGLQKEAFFLRTPCVTLREETEWSETVDLGWNRLVRGLEDPSSLLSAVNAAQPPAGIQGAPYGDGTAADRIAQHMKSMA